MVAQEGGYCGFWEVAVFWSGTRAVAEVYGWLLVNLLLCLGGFLGAYYGVLGGSYCV